MTRESDILDRSLLGVANGVLEVSNHHVIFRDINPEDNIPIHTNITYDSEFSWHHSLIEECMKWFSQIFTDRDLLHYFLKFSASCLKGNNSDKFVTIFTGEDNETMHQITNLFAEIFGNYNISDIKQPFHRNILINKFESNVLTYESIIKECVSNNFPCKIIFICERVPIIPNVDKSIEKYIRIVPLLSKWVCDAPDDEAEQYRQRKFKKDPLFLDRIQILAPAFLWIMVQYYPYYSIEGLNPSSIIEKTTEAYWRDNDVYAQFTADCIEERDGDTYVTFNEIYIKFKTWFRDSFPHYKVPERSIVRTELSSRWGTQL